MVVRHERGAPIDGLQGLATSLLQILFLLLLGDQSQEVLLSFDKIVVAEALSVLRVPRLVEVVHVELADEAREVVVLEVAWEHLLGELIGLVHDKASSRRVPLNCRLICWVLS